MKLKIPFISSSAIIISLLLISSLKAQETPFKEGLSFKLGGGLTSFYGELGEQGFSGIGNVKAGFSVSALKMLNPVLGVQVHYTGGHLYSDRPDISEYFSGFMNELGLSARLEIDQMFAPSGNWMIKPYLRAGLATTFFRSVRRNLQTNEVLLPAYGFDYDGLRKLPIQNSLAIPLAAGISFQATDRLSVELEQSLSITNSDVIDALVGTAPYNDMFGFTQVGIRYTLQPISKREPVAKKPRQSVARDSEPSSRSGRRSRKESSTDEFPDVNMFVESIIPEKPVSGKIFEVQLRINKADYTGRAILIQNLPSGFTAIESQMSDAVFSFVNQKVRILWENMPGQQEVFYSYLVRPGDQSRGQYTINGSLEYRQNSGPKTIHFANYVEVENRVESNMDSKVLAILGEEADADKKAKEEASKQQEGENLDLKIEDLLKRYGGETVKEDPVKTETLGSEKIVESQFMEGIEFRIQIAAFKVRDQGRSVVGRYNLPETVSEEYLDGLYKYTIGSFKTYADASAYRDSFIKRSRIYSAFIVAYKDGKRLARLTDAMK